MFLRRVLFFCAVLLVVLVDGGLDIVVDDDLAVDFVVVQSFGHFRHAHDAGYGEAVLRLMVGAVLYFGIGFLTGRKGLDPDILDKCF